MEGPLTLGVVKAAQRLGVGRPAMREFIRQGRIGTIRYGQRGVIRIPVSELERFAAEAMERQRK